MTGYLVQEMNILNWIKPVFTGLFTMSDIPFLLGGHHGRDCMVVEFTTPYAIIAYHH